MKNIILILILTIFTSNAQEGNPLEDPKKEQNSQPLELPNYVIEGVERLNVKSGSKQFPSVDSRFSQAILDSINSLEKKQSLNLPLENLPEDIFETKYSKGYLKASYGVFNTIDAEGSFGFDVAGYDVYLNAGIQSSDGDPKNSEYSRIYAMAFSDYIAPDKFYIFGGSKTRTMIDVNGYTYNLYGHDYSNLPIDEQTFFEKKRYDLRASVDNEGVFESVMFKTGFAFETMQLIGDPVKGFDNSLNGYLKLQNYWQNFLLAGNFQLDLRNAGGNTVNFSQLDGELEYFNEVFSISANGGFQFAVNSNEIDRAGLLLAGNLEYRINQDFTFNANIHSGLDQTTYSDLISQNPYFNQTPLIDHPYNIAKIRTGIYYHPTTYLGVTAGFMYNISDRMMMFQYDTLGAFNVLYKDGTQGNMHTEIYYKITAKDKITANTIFAFSNLNDNDKSATYLPEFKASLQYSRLWIERFNTSIGMIYVGERYGDIENLQTLDSYVDLFVNFNYDVTNNFNVFLKMNNLLNQNIYIWENFRERSLFAEFGLLWKF